jgi:hypothetical protein
MPSNCRVNLDMPLRSSENRHDATPDDLADNVESSSARYEDSSAPPSEIASFDIAQEGADCSGLLPEGPAGSVDTAVREYSGPNSAEAMSGLPEASPVADMVLLSDDADEMSILPHRQGNAPQVVCACVASGSLLAWTTLERQRSTWRLAARGTRMFHMLARSQDEIRELARQVDEFVREEKLHQVAFCRTMMGSSEQGLGDEIRWEIILDMVPDLEVDGAISSDEVAEWSIRTETPLPDAMRTVRLHYAQVRSIEMAQYLIADDR